MIKLSTEVNDDYPMIEQSAILWIQEALRTLETYAAIPQTLEVRREGRRILALMRMEYPMEQAMPRFVQAYCRPKVVRPKHVDDEV